MNFSFGLFQKAKPPVRPESDQPATPLAVWGGRRTVVSYEEVVSAHNAMRHPIIFRCLDKIAKSVGSVNWYAEFDPDVPVNKRAPSRTIEAVNDLLQYPNDYYTRSQMLYWMALNYACYGRIPIKVGVGAVAPYLPTGIYPLSARFVQANINKKGLVDSYKYGEGDNSETLPTKKTAREGAAYGYQIVKPNLNGTFELCDNINPLSAIGLPSQIIRLLLQRAADTASGHPNTKYIVAAEKTLTEPQKNELIKQLEKRQVADEESGQVLFLYNTKVQVEKLDNDLDNIHSKMPLDDMARQIAGAFDIPIALVGLGAADGAKFASNYEESRIAFWLDNLAPGYLEPIATGMTAAFAIPGMRICFDYDSIPAIQERRIAQAEKLSKVTFLTDNEKRVMVGWDEIDGGNVIRPATTTPTATQGQPTNQPQDQIQ